MKTGIIQPNMAKGDFPRNVRTLIEQYRFCIDNGAELVIAPALSLCGPGLDDLVMRSAYGRQNHEALEYLSTELGEIPLIAGTITPDDDDDQWGFFNAAYLLRNNHIEELAAQKILRDDGNSMDSRYFIPSQDQCIVDIAGQRTAILIGPDDPALIDGPCDLILRLPVAPWSIGSLEACLDDDTALAEQHSCPVIRASLTGGEEHAIHAGGSTVVNAAGALAARLALFREDCRVVDTESYGMADILPSPVEQVRQALVLGVGDFVRKSGFHSVCLGLSGGIDSALVAALAVEALGPENVHGLAMPGPYSSQGSIDDAYALAANLGISCRTVSIADVFGSLKEAMSGVFEGTKEDLTEENMQARLRGVILMSFSNKFSHLLLSTGNKSEASVGFCTMYGDTCGAVLPIGDLYKTEVYALSEHINKTAGREIIPASTLEKAPSAELRPGQTDQDSLPPYDVLDEILRELVEYNTSATDLINRMQFDEDTVRKVQRLVRNSEWKRAQAPPILAISSVAFGPGRKIPAIHRFND